MLPQVIFATQLLLCSGNIVFPQKNAATDKSYMLCALEIAKRNFPPGIITMYLPEVIENEIFTENLYRTLFHRKSWTILTMKPGHFEYVIFSRKTLSGYFLQINDTSDLTKALDILKDVIWNPNAPFVVLTSQINIQTSDLHELIKIFWHRHIINFVILLPQANSDIHYNIYSWYPYEGNNCGHIQQPKFVDSCAYGYFANDVDLFPEKVPNDLHGCRVRVQTVIWPPYIQMPVYNNNTEIKEWTSDNFNKGLEIALLNTIAERANFQLHYFFSNKPQDWGSILLNGSAGGILKAVKEETTDIVISSLAATFYRFALLEPSISYTTESLTWCVQRAPIKSKLYSVFDVFSVTLWILVMIFYIITSIVTWMISYHHLDESSAYRSIETAFLNIYAVLVSLAVKTRPRRQTLRVVFACWAILIIHIASFFQTSLLNFIMIPHYERQVETLDEMVALNFTMLYSQIALPYLQEPITPVEKIFTTRAEFCPDANKCLTEMTTDKRKQALLAPHLFLLYTQNKYRDKNGNSLLYFLKDNYISFPVHMYAYKGFPMLNRINSLIAMISQTGIKNRWESLIQQTYEFSNNLESGHQVSSIRIEHFQGALIVYVLGISLASIAFACEIIYLRFKNKRIISPYIN